MRNILYPDKFLSWVESCRPACDCAPAVLAGYSVAITLADQDCLDAAVQLARENSIEHRRLYEIVLQSYLFLGFPRMLEASNHLARCFPEVTLPVATTPITGEESEQWFERGLVLYRRVYGTMHETLKQRVESIAPEVFRWMIIEGYGKVLSRPGLSPVERELAIVACLMIENRERQLHSHLKGALNIGADSELVSRIIEDHKHTAPDGYRTAWRLFDSVINKC